MKVLSWLDRRIKYVFILPAAVFVLLMIIYPLGYTIHLSFHEWSMSNTIPKVFVGLQNYIELFQDEYLKNAFNITIAYSAIVVLIETVIGVGLALLIHQIQRGNNLIRVLFLIPMVATPVAVGMVWKLIYDPTIGVANQVLKGLGLSPLLWLSSSDTVFFSLIIIDIWQWTPLIVLIVLSGLTSLPMDVYESSKVDGADGFQTLVHITLPLLSTTILVAVLMRLIDALKTFDIVYSTTMGGPNYASENLNIMAYRYGFEFFYFGKSSAILVLFIALVFGVSLLFNALKKRVEVDYG